MKDLVSPGILKPSLLHKLAINQALTDRAYPFRGSARQSSLNLGVEATMLLLVAVAIGSGLAAAVILTPISVLAALIIAPLIASAAAILACFVIAWQSTGGDRQLKVLDLQTDVMVAALRDVAQQGAAASPIPKVRIGHKAA